MAGNSGEKSKSHSLFREALRYLPGGVNSPVRAFKAVGGDPLFIARAKGARMWDEDGAEYVDFLCSWGALILGHAPEEVILTLKEVLRDGTSFGTPSKYEVELARLICEFSPSVDMVRMVNSGTEATMSAVRLARAYKRRDKIIKFKGCYHGHGDSFLIQAGSGASTFGIPDSPGVTEGTAKDTLLAGFNDLESVNQLMELNPDQIAAVIVEPVAGNMGVIPPERGFLKGLRELTRKNDVLLIFDEVITGFRLASGGAQEKYGVYPDITTFGKIIGGGLPVGAYGGRRDIMETVAPSGPVYQAGTLSGNPLAMAAGCSTLRSLQTDGFYEQLEQKSLYLESELNAILSELDLPFKVNRAGSMITLFFTESEITDYDAALSSDTGLFSRFFRMMLDQGVYLPPSQFESIFISRAHTIADMDLFLEACRKALQQIKPLL
ncbi:MAG: glutamate-1-semialdehyde 2,1-aminomutase [Fidelibacterota bacterium]